MNFNQQYPRYSPVIFNFLLLVTFFAVSVSAQDRERVVNQTERQQTGSSDKNVNPDATRRQGLTNRIVVVNKPEERSLVKKTSSSRLTTVETKKVTNSRYLSATTQSMMFRSIQSKIGIPYRLGTQGPYRYDCSGFVWKVFQDAGMPFTRTSAREFWRTFEPVYGDERFQFGTLVFLNRLGHVGIVADQNGFYHASSSRGVTYSKFAGYWSKRIVGYRRVPVSPYSWDEPLPEEGEDN